MKRLLLLLTIPVLTYGAFTKLDLNIFWNELVDEAQIKKEQQSYCFLDDNKVYGTNINQSVRPASVSKLYTTYWALKSLGVDFRFQTQFVVKDNNLYIKGGNDPFFVTENLIIIIAEIQKRGYYKINNVYFDKKFLFNWSNTKSDISDKLINIFNTQNWSNATKQSHKALVDYVKKYNLDLQITELNFKVNNIMFSNFENQDVDGESISHFSSPLYQHLKQVNVYSNNFYSDEVFSYLGGRDKFHLFMNDEFNTDKNQLFFYTGSGLGENRTTCKITLKLLQKLRSFLSSNKLAESDVISVPSVNKGTLARRFSNFKNIIVAKTGTLRHTSTLAGTINTFEGPVFFGVFNHSWDKVSARKLQNEFIEYFMRHIVDVKEFRYEKEEYLSIKDIKIE